MMKVRKGAKIRNRYNQVPHPTQDTNEKVTRTSCIYKSSSILVNCQVRFPTYLYHILRPRPLKTKMVAPGVRSVTFFIIPMKNESNKSVLFVFFLYKNVFTYLLKY